MDTQLVKLFNTNQCVCPYCKNSNTERTEFTDELGKRFKVYCFMCTGEFTTKPSNKENLDSFKEFCKDTNYIFE